MKLTAIKIGNKTINCQPENALTIQVVDSVILKGYNFSVGDIICYTIADKEEELTILDIHINRTEKRFEFTGYNGRIEIPFEVENTL